MSRKHALPRKGAAGLCGYRQGACRALCQRSRCASPARRCPRSRHILDREGPDNRDGRDQFGFFGAPPQSRACRHARCARVRALAPAPISRANLCLDDLLGRGGHGEYLRHDGRRRASRRTGSSIPLFDCVLCRRSGSTLSFLAAYRTDALDSFDNGRAQGVLLLGDDSRHVRIRNSRRRYDGNESGLGLPRFGNTLRCTHRAPGDRAPMVRVERDLRVLVRLRRHAAARASFADWMGKPKSWGGLGWGEGAVSLGWGLAIVGFVGYLALTRGDQERSAYLRTE